MRLFSWDFIWGLNEGVCESGDDDWAQGQSPGSPAQSEAHLRFSSGRRGSPQGTLAAQSTAYLSVTAMSEAGQVFNI